MKGIKSWQARQGRVSRTRLPITPAILLQLKQVWNKEPQKFDHVMIWAACTLCFFGFLRAGEITSEGAFDPGAHLSFNDIAIDNLSNPSVMQVRIKASKTDPFRKGIDIYVGRTENDLCPIAAMLAYLAVRGDKKGPLFQFENGKSMTRDLFVTTVRAALRIAGITEDKYAGHSFRIGAATTAAQCGILDATIQMLGRWKSTAYLLYIKTPRDKLASVSKILSHNVTPQQNI